jgi:ribonuclease P protein component
VVNRLVVLKKSIDFNNIKNNGRRYRFSSWAFLSCVKNEVNEPRFGWTISTKVGSSVVRNKLKRWCRQYFRVWLQNHSQVSLDINIVFLPIGSSTIKELTYAEFEKILEKGLQSLLKDF